MDNFIATVIIDGAKVEFAKIPNTILSYVYRQLLHLGGTEEMMASSKYDECRGMLFKSIFVDGVIFADNFDKIIDTKNLNFEVMVFGKAIDTYLKKELAALKELADGKSIQTVAAPMTQEKTPELTD